MRYLDRIPPSHTTIPALGSRLSRATPRPRRVFLAFLAAPLLLLLSMSACAKLAPLPEIDEARSPAIALNAIALNAIALEAIALDAIALEGFTFMDDGPYGLELNGVGSLGARVAGAPLTSVGLDGLYINVLGENGVSHDGQGVNAASALGQSGIVMRGVVLGDTGEGTVGDATGSEENTGLTGLAINGLYLEAAAPGALALEAAALDGTGITGAGLDGLTVNGNLPASVKIFRQTADGSLEAVDLGADEEDVLMDVLYHLVGCALPRGESIAITASDGTSQTFHGLRGLAAEWKLEPLEPESEASMRACLESSPVAGQGVALGPEQEAQLDKLLAYAVQCALEAGEQVTIYAGDGSARIYSGAMGLAPGWKTGPLSKRGQRAVSACLAARANALEQPVQISLRGPRIATAAAERALYSTYEGAFWGDVFGDEPYIESCVVEGGGLSGRICAEGDDCGFTHMGDCARACDPTRDPSDGHFVRCDGESAVVSTFLSLGSRIRASDIDTRCMIEGDSTLWCWGENATGQIGDGTTRARRNPTRVRDLAEEVIAVSLGQGYTCSLESNGRASCWGLNYRGQLGDGTTRMRPSPVPVSGLGPDVADISAGEAHACAATTDGGVWCWGQNDRGQLGDGTRAAQRTAPVAVVGLGGIARLGPSIEARHSCAISGAGDLWCWGANDRAQLGNGTTADSRVPVAVDRDAHGERFEQVTDVCASREQTCARKANGTVWCWGRDRGRPHPISAGVRVAPRGLSCGSSHMCVVGIDSTVWCMGENHSQQLGYDTGGDSSPVLQQVPRLYSISVVSAGRDTTCATSSDSQLYCWGTDTQGLFPAELSLVPARVAWP